MEKNDMLRYISETENAVKDIIDRQDEIVGGALDYLKDVEHLYIVGSGTSYHAALAVKSFFEEVLSVTVKIMYAMQFKEGELVFPSNSAVIGISHAGRSSSTIKALDKAKEFGLKTIAMTVERNRPIQEHAEKCVFIEVGEELAGPKTKGYFGTIATLQLLAVNLSVKKGRINQSVKQKYIDLLKETIENINLILDKSLNWYESIKDELLKSRRIIVVGYGDNLSATFEGTLKISEAVRYSVVGYELEEFMHGIYHGIDKDTYMFYLNQPGDHFERCRRLKQYFDNERHNKNYMISSVADGLSKNDFHFNFSNHKHFQSIEYIVVLQVIARKLSEDLGINCNLSSDPQFHKKMESYTY